MRNREVVELFSRVADMLAIRGDQIHRILAYRRAAEAIDTLGRNINLVYAEGKLTEIPGIGDTLATKIEEMLTTGRLAFYDKLSTEIPPSLVDMLRIEGLGPKRVKLIYDTLNISTVDELAVAAREGKLHGLPGMGAKSQAKLLAAIDALARHGDAVRRCERDFSDHPRFTITVLRSRTEGLCGSLNEATGGRIELLSEPHDGR